MTVESVNFISDLEPDRPRSSDRISQGDDHIRNIKLSLKQTFPNVDGEVSATDEEMNYLVGLTGPIKDEIDAGANDISQLQADVAKNKTDIAANASGIATNASGISNNASAISAQGSAINANTDYIKNVEAIAVNNEREIAGLDASKADKSYVDSQNSAQNSAIASKADKSYVDSQNSAQNSVIATKADKSYVDSQDASKADKSDTYTKAQIDVLIAEASKGGGGMIKLVKQPAFSGNFTCNGNPQAYSFQLPVSQQAGDRSAKLDVPQGMVFGFEYLFGFGGTSGKLNIDVEGIYFDGVQVYDNPGSMAALIYDSSGGPIWPGSDKSTIVRVENSIEIKGMTAYATGCTVWLAGFFAEA